jgi:opacity protein-like surface antigen
MNGSFTIITITKSMRNFIMKKALLSTTALLVAAGIATPSIAQWTISAGIQSAQLEVESDSEAYVTPSTPNPFATSSFDFSRNDQDTSIGGELAVGYQYNINNVYNVALEGFGQLSAAEVDVDAVSPYDANASVTWVAGLRLRPGYYVTPSTRLFIDGGVVLGGFELEQAENTIQGAERALKTSALDKTEVDTLCGWRYGVGIEHKMTENFVMGVDYTVTEFETYTSDFLEDAVEIAHAQGKTGDAKAEYSPTLSTLGLNFKYLFGAKKQPRRYQMMDK